LFSLNTCSSVTLLLVVTLTSTTFTSTMIICVSIGWTFILPQISHETFYASQQTLDNLSFYVHSDHICGMHMNMAFVVFDLFMWPLWLPLWSGFFSFYMSPHCDSSSHNFMQCLLVFLLLLCVFVSVTCLVLCVFVGATCLVFSVFVGATCWVLYGTKSAFLVSALVMPSSYNIVASLCCNFERSSL
jgi:hypothetical protein